MKKLLGVFAAAVLSMAPGTGHAQPIAGTCSSSDITLNWVGAALPGAFLGCVGAFNGNDNPIPTELDDFLNTWMPAYEDRGSSDVAMTFGPFTSNPGGSTGTLVFDTNVFGVFGISLKAGNFWSAYAFDVGASGVSGFGYNTIGTAKNCSKKTGACTGQGLSHASLYSEDGETSIVPEPASMALVSAGLIGLVGAVRRRRA